MKNIVIIFSILLFSLSANAQKKEKTYKVLTACGQCQLDMKSKPGCSLAIQMAGKKYWVEGSTFSDHGDEHADDGLCKTIRKAEVKGTFEDEIFKSSSFTIIPIKKRKRKK